jgi:hypothetical protein
MVERLSETRPSKRKGCGTVRVTYLLPPCGVTEPPPRNGHTQELARLRDSRLPRETGGVDSRGSREGFERGVVGLKAGVNAAV